MEANEDDDQNEIAKIEGCTIHWTSPKNNLTVIVKQKKQRNKNTKQIRVVEREEKCESFFHFFNPPKDPHENEEENDDDKNDEGDEDFYDEEVAQDIEAGQVLIEALVPRAAYYYSGKAVEEVAKELRQAYGGDL